MDKKIAIDFINHAFSTKNLNYSNCSFASINTATPVWWLNNNPLKFKKDFYIILDDSSQLILIFLPANTFPEPSEYFSIRADKNLVDLRISCDKDYYYLKDLAGGGKGVDFSSFIKNKIEYPDSLRVEKSEKKSSRSGRLKKSQVPSYQEIIKEGQTGISYHHLFSLPLKGAKKIKLQDPYIRLQHQFKNLLEFCVMLGNNKAPEEKIKIEVISWNTREFLQNSRGCFEELAASVAEMGIDLIYKLEKHHDRFIEADNGLKIILGRGLDIFEKTEGRFSVGEVDQAWRKCKACEITYVKK